MVKENWVDIANKKSDGSYPKCGRSGGEKRKNYPSLPIAKARAMSKGQKASAVRVNKKLVILVENPLWSKQLSRKTRRKNKR